MNTLSRLYTPETVNTPTPGGLNAGLARDAATCPVTGQPGWMQRRAAQAHATATAWRADGADHAHRGDWVNAAMLLGMAAASQAEGDWWDGAADDAAEGDWWARDAQGAQADRHAAVRLATAQARVEFLAHALAQTEAAGAAHALTATQIRAMHRSESINLTALWAARLP
jgi:hypothetical protein